MMYDPLGETDFCSLDATKYDSRRMAIRIVVYELHKLGVSTTEVLTMLKGLPI